jgi:hypothetical protein
MSSHPGPGAVLPKPEFPGHPSIGEKFGLGHSILTQADTWEDLRAHVRDAVRCHFDEGQAPRVIRLHRVLDDVLALA